MLIENFDIADLNSIVYKIKDYLFNYIEFYTKCIIILKNVIQIILTSIV